MSIYFARHGETDWNVAMRIQGTTDIPLNENGIKQAESLYENLKKENVKLFKVYSSYQKRALTTAEVVGNGYHVPVKVVNGLQEINFGKFEGHTWEEIQEQYEEKFTEWESNKRYQRTPNGECYQDLLIRVFTALDEIIEDMKENFDEDKDILILTHGAVVMSLLTLKENLDFRTSYQFLRIENAKPIKLEISDLEEIRSRLND